MRAKRMPNDRACLTSTRHAVTAPTARRHHDLWHPMTSTRSARKAVFIKNGDDRRVLARQPYHAHPHLDERRCLLCPVLRAPRLLRHHQSLRLRPDRPSFAGAYADSKPHSSARWPPTVRPVSSPRIPGPLRRTTTRLNEAKEHGGGDPALTTRPKPQRSAPLGPDEA